jgi:hypothetical protein
MTSQALGVCVPHSSIHTQDSQDTSLKFNNQVFGGFLNSIRESDEMHAKVSHYH